MDSSEAVKGRNCSGLGFKRLLVSGSGFRVYPKKGHSKLRYPIRHSADSPLPRNGLWTRLYEPFPKGPKIRAQIPKYSWYLGPKTLLFGALDPYRDC